MELGQTNHHKGHPFHSILTITFKPRFTVQSRAGAKAAEKMEAKAKAKAQTEAKTEAVIGAEKIVKSFVAVESQTTNEFELWPKTSHSRDPHERSKTNTAYSKKHT